ncbi:MAG: hypothetical protein JXA94_05640 [Parachlamydiales bacterium]|nr:hypothetical protein [Parachlamydiales bacterium]
MPVSDKKYQDLIKDTVDYLKELDTDSIYVENIDFLELEAKSSFSKKVNPANSSNETFKKPNIQQPIKNKPFEEKITSVPFTKKPTIQEKPLPALEKPFRNEIIPPNPIIASSIEIKNNKKNEDQKQNVLNKKTFEKSLTPQTPEQNLSDIEKILLKIDSSIEISEKPLDDKIAKKVAQKYKFKNMSANITILAYKENEKAFNFLNKMRLALENTFLPTKVVSAYVIEKSNSWDTFLNKEDINLIISSDYTVFELNQLKSFYVEIPAKNEKFLKDIPLLLLPDINLYLKEPMLKPSLYKTLKLKIESLQNV